MTIADMIALLQAMPDKSLRVVVNGYEGGYSDASGIECFKMALNVNKERWYGPHERVDYILHPETKREEVLAILVH